MPKDTYGALWVSYSSLSDFLACPRSYYLKQVYKDSKNNHKIQLIGPPLSLGKAVHTVLESLSVLPVEKRFSESLLTKFNTAWEAASGKKGGFTNREVEAQYKDRGRAMLERVMHHPGPLTRKAVKIKDELPKFWLSEEDGIILCGKIDWLEYIPVTESVHIIDFKTSKKEELSDSLQLPIYNLLAHYCQRYPVVKASYWYLELRDTLDEKELPDLTESQERILSLAKKIKLARTLEKLDCPKGQDGCMYCRPYEAVLRGEAEYIGEDEYRRDIYLSKGIPIANGPFSEDDEESVIL